MTMDQDLTEDEYLRLIEDIGPGETPHQWRPTEMGFEEFMRRYADGYLPDGAITTTTIEDVLQ